MGICQVLKLLNQIDKRFRPKSFSTGLSASGKVESHIAGLGMLPGFIHIPN
jgi:hypothetical protein